ncbi:MAG: hypothetical protein HY703_12470 [Gemmatimonadetes bacterium]|nr:hypothetical protein [Gemmatimonadota bacterium]
MAPVLPKTWLLAAALLTAAGWAGSGAAQTVSLDEGAFRLSVHGKPAGTESFSIRRNGSGALASVIAQGRIVLDTAAAGEEITALLEVAGPALRPSAYQVKLDGAESRRIAGRVVGGRFSAKILSPAGEMMREYLASDGAVLVDEGVAHHYYFLAQRLGDGKAQRVPLLIPRQSRQVMAQVTSRSVGPLDLEGSAVEARHLVIDLPDGVTHHVWVDRAGRVLRLEIPARAYRAVRTTPPPTP